MEGYMPFKKGHSGNPRGRPRSGQAMTDFIRRELSHKDANGVPQKRAVARKLIDLALAGDIHAMKYLIDRIDGKPKEMVDMAAKVNTNTEVVKMSREERMKYIIETVGKMEFVYTGKRNEASRKSDQ
jgi:hypothetical protein